MKKHIIVTVLLVFLTGCTFPVIREVLLGMSSGYVENAPEKYTKVFEKTPLFCYEKTIEAVNGMNAKVEHKDSHKYFIVADRFEKVFPFCIDTTKVGILIKSPGEGKAEVMVASGNYNLAEFVADKIFKKLGELK